MMELAAENHVLLNLVVTYAIVLILIKILLDGEYGNVSAKRGLGKKKPSIF